MHAHISTLFVLFILYDCLVFSQSDGAISLSKWVYHVDEKQCGCGSAGFKPAVLDLHCSSTTGLAFEINLWTQCIYFVKI